MNKIIKRILFIILTFVSFIVIMGYMQNAYAFTKSEADQIRPGDILETTIKSKIYSYNDRTLRMFVQSINTDIRIPIGVKFEASAVDGQKCYKKVRVNGRDIYYFSVEYRQSCYVHYSNLKIATVLEADKREEETFLNTRNIQKILDGKARELEDQQLIDAVRKAREINLKTGSLQSKNVENRALLELQDRGYRVRNRSDGSYTIVNEDEEDVADVVGGDEATDSSDIFYAPDRIGTESSGQSIDDVFNDADSFVEKADPNVGTVREDSLEQFSGTMFNILATIGVAISVIVGLVIGIKFMIGGVAEKAEIKQMIIPYIVGCVIVFGAFGIWKMVIEIMKTI